MFQFNNRTIYNNIFIVGCGGTGSRLMPMLVQFLRTITRPHNPMGILENPKIYLVDDDVVEQKNLLRQNFIDQDVGKPKAVVLADRYSRAFGMELLPIVRRIVPHGTLPYGWYRGRTGEVLEVPGNVASTPGLLSMTGSLIILCVDSAKARRDILKVIHEDDLRVNVGPTMIIDAGNEDNFGQVRFFNYNLLTDDNINRYDQALSTFRRHMGVTATLKNNPYVHPVNIIPFPRRYYEELGESVAEKSCADLDQTLAINAIMATTIMGIVQNLYFFKPMNYDGIRMSLDGGNAVEFNTPERWFSRVAPYQRDGLPTSRQDNAAVSKSYCLGVMNAVKAMGMKFTSTGELVPINPPVLAKKELTSIQDGEADAVKATRVARKPRPRPESSTAQEVAVPAPPLASAAVVGAPALTPIARGR